MSRIPLFVLGFFRPLRDNLFRRDAIGKGALVVTGGSRVPGLDGAYYRPTILTDLTKEMRIWKEEVFGPVLAVYPFTTEQEAIEQANDSRYGLGSLVFTNDKQKAVRVASKLQTGTVEINAANRPRPRLSPG